MGRVVQPVQPQGAPSMPWLPEPGQFQQAGQCRVGQRASAWQEPRLTEQMRCERRWGEEQFHAVRFALQARPRGLPAQALQGLVLQPQVQLHVPLQAPVLAEGPAEGRVFLCVQPL